MTEDWLDEMTEDWLDENTEQWLENGQLEGRSKPWTTFADFIKYNPGSISGDWERYRKTYWGEIEWEDFWSAIYEDMNVEEYWERWDCIDFL